MKLTLEGTNTISHTKTIQHKSKSPKLKQPLNNFNKTMKQNASEELKLSKNSPKQIKKDISKLTPTRTIERRQTVLKSNEYLINYILQNRRYSKKDRKRSSSNKQQEPIPMLSESKLKSKLEMKGKSAIINNKFKNIIESINIEKADETLNRFKSNLDNKKQEKGTGEETKKKAPEFYSTETKHDNKRCIQRTCDDKSKI